MDDSVVDREALGRLMRGARMIAGFDSVEQAAEAIRGAGAEITAKALYAIEKGDRAITLEQFVAVLMAYPGLRTPAMFFLNAFREDAQAVMTGKVRFESGEG